MDTLEDFKQRVRELEEQLAQAASQAVHYKLFYDNAPLGYQSLNEHGALIEVNKAYLNAIGYQEHEVLGHHFTEFLTSASQSLFYERFARFKETGKACDVEYEIICKNGAVRVFSLFGVVRANEQGEFVQTHCILEDVTERKRMEQEHEQQRKELEIANSALTRVISHVEQEKSSIKGDMVLNIEHRIKPLVQKIWQKVHREEELFSLLRQSLDEITEGFPKQLRDLRQTLTKSEMEVAELVKAGRSVKEIAMLKGISPTTAKTHVRNIRKKLGLSNTKKSLQVFLDEITKAQ